MTIRKPARWRTTQCAIARYAPAIPGTRCRWCAGRRGRRARRFTTGSAISDEGIAVVAQLVVRRLGKTEVIGSIPVDGTTFSRNRV